MQGWLFWLLLPGLGPCPPLDRPGWFVDARVSSTFVCSVLAAHDAVPRRWRTQLREGGWKIEVVPAIAVALPDLADTAPRGWPAGWTWKHVDAVHLPDQRRLIFAEWRLDLQGRLVRCNRIAGVVRHEMAHAWDLASPGVGGFSSSEAFRRAYLADLRHLGTQEQARLRYFVQPTMAGRQETLAELLAVWAGGGSAPALGPDLIGAFPRSWKLLRSRIEGGPTGIDRTAATDRLVAPSR